MNDVAWWEKTMERLEKDAPKRMLWNRALNPSPKRRAYTKQDITYLKDFYPTKGPIWCAKHLNRSVRAIYEEARILSLHVQDIKRVDRSKVLNWMQNYIKEQQSSLVDCAGVAACADAFECSITTIKDIRRMYNLQPLKRGLTA